MRFFFKLFLFFCCIAVGAVALGLGAFSYYAKDLPDPARFKSREVTQSTKIYDRAGEILLYEIHGEERRTVIPFEQIPDYLKKATIAIEDDNFYGHPAFDWRAIVRAIAVDILRGGLAQGGSTITQQLVKKAFLTDEKTLARKIKELALALKMEREYSKDEILNLYLNQVPYGSNAYGVEAASQTFFAKNVADLTLAESALLAALPRRPSYYSPYGSHVNELKARQEFILEKMRRLDLIDEEELERAKAAELKFAPPTNEIRAPHFVMYVRDYLNNTYGEDFIERAGLRVITTLDWNLQQVAEKAVKEGAERNKKLYNGNNAALVAQDPKTGQILAMVGSVDYFDREHDGNFNVATQGLRQPGSAFKPFAYFTAFEKGYTPETIVFDLPTKFDTTGGPEKSYAPENYDKKFRGPITLRNALAQSVNIPSVKALYVAGIEDTIRTAEKTGVTTLADRSRFGLSLVLGGGEVRLVEMVNAFSVFAQEGVKHEQSIVLSVEEASVKILEEYRDSAQAVLGPQYVRLLNDVLSDEQARRPLFGPNSLLTIPGHDIAAKTGTTNDFRDAWTIGYTPGLLAGVWAGNNDNTPMNIGGVSILAAVPIWNAFMIEALGDRPRELFTRPDAIQTAKPILNGEYVVNFSVGNKTYPHVHDLLFYVDKDDPQGPIPQNPALDPQYANWEKPVIEWAREHIPNFHEYNQPLPPEYEIIQSGQYQPIVHLISPVNGAFVGNALNIQAEFTAPLGISRIRLLLNGAALDSVVFDDASEAPTTRYVYALEKRIDDIAPQNQLRLEVTDIFNNTAFADAIVYR
ncbi:MAG: hypothetical protein A3J67_04160 [Parcubacteria group bacterium RIFCSPHIGHO2_02_FULL_48_10b]|nr:MAG: hypothetical protein A3J67_04160 [Parcubacteria group bacterium RIFCSPHIGHO2_02_FULL_48_10b]